jgi:hypothetical protein
VQDLFTAWLGMGKLMRRLASQHFIKKGAEGVNVASTSDCFSACLLG